MNQRTSGANLGSGDTLHDGIGPAHQAFRRDGDDGFLHGIEHGCQFLTTAFDLGKTLTQMFGGQIERILHRGEFVRRSTFQAGAQVSIGNSAGKIHNPVEPCCNPTGDPSGNRQGHSQGNQSSTLRVPPGDRSIRRLKTNSITTVWKTSNRTKRPSSLVKTLRVKRTPLSCGRLRSATRQPRNAGQKRLLALGQLEAVTSATHGL